MTSTTLAVLDGLADALEKVADALDAFDRDDRATAARVLPALDRADDQESENYHNG